MNDAIDSLIEILSGFQRVYWHDIPDNQKMIKPVSRWRQSASGYGSKIPTDKMVNYRGRWHRIYCRIYSNVGTCYFVSKGKEVIVS